MKEYNKVIREEDEKKMYSVRLKKIAGQVNGIYKMVEDDRHCAEILIQVSAVDKALKSLGQELLLNHMKTCMVDEIKNDHIESIDEVMELCRRLI